MSSAIDALRYDAAPSRLCLTLARAHLAAAALRSNIWGTWDEAIAHHLGYLRAKRKCGTLKGAMAWRGTFGKEIIEGLRPAFNLVYPPRCASCGASIAAHGALCGECWGELEFPGNVEKPDAETGERHSGIIAATLYNDMSRSLLLKFKHGGKLALAPVLGRMIASRISSEEGEQPLIIPVPLHRTRIWQRGYNQSAMLAREVVRAGKGELLVDGLVRIRRTPSLGDLPSDERHAILDGAIAVRSGAREAIKGRAIILVDDVLTSGATSTACVEALLEAGADTVRIACFARARRAAFQK